MKRAERCFLCCRPVSTKIYVPHPCQVPSMANANNMIHITQRKLQQLIRQYTSRIREPKQRMIRKHRPQPHRPSMQNRLMTQTTQTRMPMHNLNALPHHHVSKNRKKRKHRRESGFSVDYEEGDVVDLEAVGEVADAGAAFVGVGDDDDFVAAVDEFGGELVDVGFYAAGLREEEVADHGDVVCHFRAEGFWIRGRIGTL